MDAEPAARGDAARRIAGTETASRGAIPASLAGLVDQIGQARDNTATGAREIAADHQDLSARSASQARPLQQATASMRQQATRWVTTTVSIVKLGSAASAGR